MNKREQGRGGELIAAEYLKKKKYKILAMNFRCGLGEIDIIARKGKTLCFVEVKLRKSREFGSPLEAVDRWKSKTIIRTAEYYCMKNNITDSPLSFDVVGIDCSSGEPVIDHVENALAADQS